MMGNVTLQLVSIINPTSFENKPLVLFKRGFILYLLRMRHKNLLVKINSLRWFLDSNWSMMVITSQVSPDSSWIVADHQLKHIGSTRNHLQCVKNQFNHLKMIHTAGSWFVGGPRYHNFNQHKQVAGLRWSTAWTN